MKGITGTFLPFGLTGIGFELKGFWHKKHKDEKG